MFRDWLRDDNLEILKSWSWSFSLLNRWSSSRSFLSRGYRLRNPLILVLQLLILEPVTTERPAASEPEPLKMMELLKMKLFFCCDPNCNAHFFSLFQGYHRPNHYIATQGQFWAQTPEQLRGNDLSHSLMMSQSDVTERLFFTCRQKKKTFIF